MLFVFSLGGCLRDPPQGTQNVRIENTVIIRQPGGSREPRLVAGDTAPSPLYALHLGVWPQQDPEPDLISRAILVPPPHLTANSDRVSSRAPESSVAPHYPWKLK